MQITNKKFKDGEDEYPYSLYEKEIYTDDQWFIDLFKKETNLVKKWGFYLSYPSLFNITVDESGNFDDPFNFSSIELK